MIRKIITSWVIRTKNEGKWLEVVLKLLFSQTRQDFEVIIVDSGSTDKTLEIVKKFPIKKIIKIPEKKFNYSYALNLGIKNSKGKFIGIISGHSLPINKIWYENVMQNFKDKKVAAVSGYYTSLPDGSFLEKLGDFFLSFKKMERKFYSKEMTNTNAIIRKDLWKKYHFDEDLNGCEDYDWASEMLSKGFNIIKDPKFNVYHSHGGLNRPTFYRNFLEWKKIRKIVDQKRFIELKGKY